MKKWIQAKLIIAILVGIVILNTVGFFVVLGFVDDVLNIHSITPIYILFDIINGSILVFLLLNIIIIQINMYLKY